jgi:predicted dehydrogenase
MQTVQWGIIGCGDVTEKKSGPAFNKVHHSRLVAVMRRDEEKAKSYAERHGVSKWYSNAQELINDEEVNAIYVATPPLFHEEYTCLALKAGKPVYVEKPMATNVAGAHNMMATSQQTGCKLSVAHYRRQQALFKKIKSLVDTNAIGDIRIINLRLLQSPRPTLVSQTGVNWRTDPAISGGGFFHDLAPHQLDLMLYFFGKPVKALGTSVNQAGLYEAHDAVTGFILFQRNILFSGTWCFTVSPNEECDECEIIGSEGAIRFSIFQNNELILVKNGDSQVLRFEPLQHVQQPMIEAVVKYFLGEDTNPCSADDGVEVMRLIEAFTKTTMS